MVQGCLYGGFIPPTGQEVKGGSDDPHHTHYATIFTVSGDYFNFKIEDYYFRHNNACSFLLFYPFVISM